MSHFVTLNSLIDDKLVVCVSAPDPSISEGFFDYGARGVLSLGGSPSLAENDAHDIIESYSFDDMTSNNGQVLVLHGRSIFALHNKRNFWGLDTETVLVSREHYSFWMRYWIGRYRRRRILNPLGVVRLDDSREYLAFSVPARHKVGRALFGSPRLSQLETARSFSDLDVVLLRGYHSLESGSTIRDLDILVSDSDVPKLRSRLSSRIGTRQIDTYSETGIHGFSTQSCPYYMPNFARDIISSSIIRESGIRVPSPEYGYLSYIYHLLFHKSFHFPPDAEIISRDMIGERGYDRLCRHCADAGVSVPSTITEIDDILVSRGYFPSKEHLTFYARDHYARDNLFINSRYLSNSVLRPGLSTFFVRGYEGISDQRDFVRDVLGSEYEIICEGDFDISRDYHSLCRVRGGNWHDPDLDLLGYPSYWFCCYDSCPIDPVGDMASHYPYLDNSRNARIKARIRNSMPDRVGLVVSCVHGSDNSDQAYENVVDLGYGSDESFVRIVSLLTPSPS